MLQFLQIILLPYFVIYFLENTSAVHSKTTLQQNADSPVLHSQDAVEASPFFLNT